MNAEQEEELKAMIQDMVKKHIAKNQQVLDDSEEELYE